MADPKAKPAKKIKPYKATKPCPKCGRKMILYETGTVLMSYPCQHERMWWCGCGHVMEAPPRKMGREQDVLRKAWKEAQ